MKKNPFIHVQPKQLFSLSHKNTKNSYKRIKNIYLSLKSTVRNNTLTVH